MKRKHHFSNGVVLSFVCAFAHCPFISAAATVRGSIAQNPGHTARIERLVGHSLAEAEPSSESGKVADRDGVDGNNGNGGLPLIGDLDEDIIIWPDVSSFSFQVETWIALVWVTMVAMFPAIVIKIEGGNLTRTQLALFILMWAVFFAGVYLFTNVLLFQSVHFKSIRPLTIVEAVYFMSQILTTVGYGDITPAKPRGQVFVAFYVLFSLLTLANVISEVVDTVAARSKRLATELLEDEDSAQQQDTPGRGQGAAPRRTLFRQVAQAPEPNLRGLLAAVATYMVFAFIGTMFFRFYPGEGKTVVQGVYMSIITLSTVGFGAFTPVTEYGLVFAAFWMLFGSAALLSVIGQFSDLLIQLKMRERWHSSKHEDELGEFLARAPESMSQYDFLKQVMIHRKLVSESGVDFLSNFFDSQSDNNGLVTKDKLEAAVEQLALPSVFSAN
mmetsp:Transcript_44699/g.103328  ORF Transcript_44699/g.103328 Transcript_44699/m.103328 type:complete len:443 (-) Transcript_44699:157-1485(-)